ncbi:MAG: M17 family peptidase N-terminal domain-containing protein, partial [Bdellovibrionales bacterium]
MLAIDFLPLRLPGQGALAITVASGQKLGAEGSKLDQKLQGALKRAMAGSSFTGAAEQVLAVLAPANMKLSRILLVGIGDENKADEMTMQRVGGMLYAALAGGKDTQATLLLDTHKELAIAPTQAAACIAYGARLRSYRFDKYRTKLKPE